MQPSSFSLLSVASAHARPWHSSNPLLGGDCILVHCARVTTEESPWNNFWLEAEKDVPRPMPCALMEPCNAGILGWSSFTLWADDTRTGARMSPNIRQQDTASTAPTLGIWDGRRLRKRTGRRCWNLRLTSSSSWTRPHLIYQGVISLCVASLPPLYRCIETDTGQTFPPTQVMLCNAASERNWKPIWLVLSAIYWLDLGPWSRQWSPRDLCAGWFRGLQAIDIRQKTHANVFPALWQLPGNAACFPSAASASTHLLWQTDESAGIPQQVDELDWPGLAVGSDAY